MKLKTPFLYVMLYLFLGMIAFLSINPLMSAINSDDLIFEDYQSIDSVDLKIDTMPWTGTYIPSAEKSGLRVLVERSNNPKLSLIISIGIYRLDFYDGNMNVFSTVVDIQAEDLQTVDLNKNIFYDSITIRSMTGKNNRLTFMMPVQNESDLEGIETLTWSAYQSALGGNSYYATNPDRSLIQAITANLVSVSDTELSLNVRNVSNMDIQLLSIRRVGKDTSYEFVDTFLSKDKFGENNIITIPFSDFNKTKDYEIVYKYVDLDFESTVAISMLDNTNMQIVYDTGIIANELEFEPYFKINGHQIVLNEDHTVIDQAVVIPEGYVLTLFEGQSITFINDGFIRSYSPVDFKGSEVKPIVINAEGLSQSGIAVIQADSVSSINYTIFDNLTNISHFVYTTTGAVNFFESDLVMDNSTIINNRSEDGLNVVRSHFEVSNTTFENTYSDAFDSDFSNGNLSNGHFLNTGNDGFDCSGSDVSVTDTEFIVIGDKALSIGEHTTIYGSNLVIDTSDLGIAIKDSSTSTFDNIYFNDIYLSFIQYNKKPVFGVSSSKLSNIHFSGDIGLYYLIQEHEHLIIDDEVYIPENLSKSEQIFDALINERPIR